jgi:hypothetical protein
VRGLRLTIICGAVTVGCVLTASSAVGEDIETRKACDSRGCYVISKGLPKPPHKSRSGTADSAERRTDRQDAENQRLLEASKKLSAELAEYNRRLAEYNRCVLTFDPSLNNAGCGSAPTPPIPPQFSSTNFSGPGNQPTAGQAAAIAVARLQLPKIAPGIGPSPDINPWKMAAVGYPLWLWGDGPTQVGPISDSVAGLSVSLDAVVSSLTFRMGDGHTVTCAGSGHTWTTAVQPGTESPSCGYTYAKPSLPDKTYTVAAIANWAVTWTSNGQSGVINVPVVDTAELPVGELQVLVR